tara:strand:+ start:233 stop:685 length:453 start_codon:yes stop_codon:yes gene_type:complete
MSSALARARNRRGGTQETVQTNQKPPTPPPSPSNNQRPNTINDIFNTIKIRLDGLEENQKDMVGNSSFSEELISEYEARFETILNEITQMKDVIMKLQTFTMEVNKSLYDDRINILSNDADIQEIEHISEEYESSDETEPIHTEEIIKSI